MEQPRLNGTVSLDAVVEPLAARLRPRTLDEFIGQAHLLGAGQPLRAAIERGQLHSAILWGPPGCGKSTLALLLARHVQAPFEAMSAVVAGVAEVRQVIAAARQRRQRGQRTVLFLDEVHRFNKAQQDALLPAVEDGTLIFIGATTENPFFYLTPPLLSRCRLYRLEPLTPEQVLTLLKRALTDERGLGRLRVQADDDALQFIADRSGGDARRALNALEATFLTAQGSQSKPQAIICVTRAVAESVLRDAPLAYQRAGDDHYDVASAFIKSVRGSDPDAALYWLARFLASGEDPRFIARRMVIAAAEDIGLADPQALVIAVAAAHAVDLVGVPEAQIPLAEAAIYLAAAPKSDSAYKAIAKAMDEIARHGPQPVPPHLRDASYKGAKQLGHGVGYLSPHDVPDRFVKQSYLPPTVRGLPFYEPTEQGFEKVIAARLHRPSQGTR
ncbi:putative AAA domain-containing protein [bacterium HR17]|uniref:Replication-associated recombination protein A n=1 Tax=Candidatus Fervidibacter japonicus TaxID=2035412 RepID=A0A2H5XG10_9BACT|nr:putative AAA domain-containing protein [bacterium HR17]